MPLHPRQRTCHRPTKHLALVTPSAGRRSGFGQTTPRYDILLAPNRVLLTGLSGAWTNAARRLGTTVSVGFFACTRQSRRQAVLPALRSECRNRHRSFSVGLPDPTTVPCRHSLLFPGRKKAVIKGPGATRESAFARSWG